ncbi:hypothetical protein ATANTOWER_001685 [Ataeniobius toweri]|uniref:Uncharacterized protein n=1 Tax=Ataeniobius toweri TaxID=208326 RepID=A0ABU7ANR6_9TELE|nr:hypothetical protein [Ataeniobius toweri]
MGSAARMQPCLTGLSCGFVPIPVLPLIWQNVTFTWVLENGCHLDYLQEICLLMWMTPHYKEKDQLLMKQPPSFVSQSHQQMQKFVMHKKLHCQPYVSVCLPLYYDSLRCFIHTCQQ